MPQLLLVRENKQGLEPPKPKTKTKQKLQQWPQ
jgi:hypothetical protein